MHDPSKSQNQTLAHIAAMALEVCHSIERERRSGHQQPNNTPTIPAQPTISDTPVIDLTSEFANNEDEDETQSPNTIPVPETKPNSCWWTPPQPPRRYMFREHGRFVRLWFGGPPHKGFTADPATMVVRVHEMATPKALPRPLIGPYPSKAAWISFFGEHQARYNACGIVSHDMAGKPAVRTMGYIAAITRTLQTISGSIISSARILYENEAPVTTVIIVASIKNIPAINNISSWLHLYASGEVVKIPELYREGVGVIFEEMRRLHESRPRVAVYFYRRLFEGSLCRRLNMHLTTLLEEDGELDSILLNIEK